jgi:SAM-dependent methyltransferase
MNEPMTQPAGPRRLALLDKYLAGAAADLLGHDPRTADLDVDVRFDQGVAHLSGAVAAPEHLRLVRELVGRLAGVHAVWDRVRVAGRDPIVVDLGSGNTVQYDTNIGVDRRPGKAVAVLADLRYPLPFADSRVDGVFTVHVLEHLPDYLPLVAECHRILRPGGVLHVMAPWWRHVNAVADPTHIRFFDAQTVKGICAGVGGGPQWYPLHVSCDGASVLADLVPVKGDQLAPDDVTLGRFFT